MALKVYINPDRDKIKENELQQIKMLVPKLNSCFADQDAVLLIGDIILECKSRYSNPIDAVLITSYWVFLIELKSYKNNGTVYCDEQDKIKIVDNRGRETIIHGGKQGSPLTQIKNNRVFLIKYIYDFLKRLNIKFTYSDRNNALSDKSTSFPAFVIINGTNSSHPLGKVKSRYAWAHIVNNDTFVDTLKNTLDNNTASIIPIDELTDKLGFTKNGSCARGYQELDPATGNNKTGNNKTGENKIGEKNKSQEERSKHSKKDNKPSDRPREPEQKAQGTNNDTKRKVDKETRQNQELTKKTDITIRTKNDPPRSHIVKPPTRIYLICAAAILLICMILAVAIIPKPHKSDTSSKRQQTATAETQAENIINADSLYVAGLEEYEAGNIDDAEYNFAKAAEAGDIKAAYNLGRIYYNDEKYKEAIRLFQQSASSNDRDALFFLGIIYMEGKGVIKDQRKALEYWNKAIENGSVEAMYSVGELYYNLKDYTNALMYFKAAAALGHAPSMYLMSIFYDYGLGGVTQDHSKAREWENTARKNGYIPN